MDKKHFAKEIAKELLCVDFNNYERIRFSKDAYKKIINTRVKQNGVAPKKRFLKEYLVECPDFNGFLILVKSPKTSVKSESFNLDVLSEIAIYQQDKKFICCLLWLKNHYPYSYQIDFLFRNTSAETDLVGKYEKKARSILINMHKYLSDDKVEIVHASNNVYFIRNK